MIMELFIGTENNQLNWPKTKHTSHIPKPKRPQGFWERPRVAKWLTRSSTFWGFQYSRTKGIFSAASLNTVLTVLLLLREFAVSNLGLLAGCADYDYKKKIDQRKVDVLCDHDQKVPTNRSSLSVCHITFLSGYICSDTLSLTYITLHTDVHSCSVVSTGQLLSALNNISMVGCVLPLTSQKCDSTTAFIEGVEKVKRKQCDNIHSWCFLPVISQKCCVSVSQSLCYIMLHHKHRNPCMLVLTRCHMLARA